MTTSIVFLIGPTAAGKSAASLALAERWPLEIIVMDSATIYRHMDIGTAKPSRAEQKLIRHHLLDIVDPAEQYDVASFVEDTIRLINNIQQRGRHVLICGGTLMYYHALTRGLSPLPKADPKLRAQIEAEARTQGWPALHAQLAQIDPTTAERLAPNDSQRIQRALEVYRATQTPLSIWQQRPKIRSFQHDYLSLSLEPARRQELHPRMAERFHQMLEAGLLAEVEALYERGDLHLDLPSIRCVGYRQLWQYLAGEKTFDVAVARAIHATEQLAKRQMTWLRSLSERQRLDCLDPRVVAKVVDRVASVWA